MSLRILIVSDFYAPIIGGVERQMGLIAKHLVHKGYEISVATVWHEGLAEQEDIEGVQVYRLKALTTRIPWFFENPKARRHHPPFPDPAIVYSLRKLIHHLRPDVVHTTGWIAYSCSAALLGKKIPMMISIREYGYTCATRNMMHNGEICSGPSPIKCVSCAARTYGKAKGFVSVVGVYASHSLLTHKIRTVHSISSFVQEVARRDLLKCQENVQISKRHNVPDVIIPNFLESPRIQAVPDPKILEKLPQESYILFVGALQPIKGLNVLLDAYARLVSPPPLVLIGTVWQDTPREFPPGVTVLTNVPHPTVMIAWERCLFGIAPSRWPETFCSVIIEAMSKGKPVIATNRGGPLDIVVDGETGFLIPPDNVNELSNVMKQLIDSPELRERFGQQGKKRQVELFVADSVIPHYERLYKQLAYH